MTQELAWVSAALADRYRIERELGQGGMATVYLAEDIKHHRRVAIKVLRPDLAAVLGAERFLNEIETTANLRHPHILPLFDSGEVKADDGRGPLLYYVMPYVEGESLRDRLDRDKQLPIEEALLIAREPVSISPGEHGLHVRPVRAGDRGPRPRPAPGNERDAVSLSGPSRSPVPGAPGPDRAAPGAAVIMAASRW